MKKTRKGVAGGAVAPARLVMGKRTRRLSRRKKRMLIWALVLALAALVPTGLRLWRTALSERAPVEALLDSGLTVESLPPFA